MGREHTERVLIQAHSLERWDAGQMHTIKMHINIFNKPQACKGKIADPKQVFFSGSYQDAYHIWSQVVEKE